MGKGHPAPPHPFILQNCVDFRNIINFQVYLLFLADGVLEDKTHEKGLVSVYIFQKPIALSNTGRFRDNSER